VLASILYACHYAEMPEVLAAEKALASGDEPSSEVTVSLDGKKA